MRRTNTATWIESQQRWRIAVQKDNVRKWFYSRTPGKAGQRECNQKADDWLDGGIEAGQRVDKAFELWYKELQKTTGFGNYRSIESRWRTWSAPVVGHMKIDKVNDYHLQQILNNASAAGLSKKTLQSIKGDLQQFFKWARKSRLTGFTPEFVEIPKSARYKGKTILTPEDLHKLFSIDTTIKRGKTVPDEFINAYRLLVLTGMRPGELLGLEWRDIDGLTVNIHRSINMQGKETKGKNENALRAFNLSEQAARVLDAQRAASTGKGSVFGIDREQYLFVRWKAYCAANGLTVCSLYELRHSFVSIVKSLPEGELKSLVGHSRSMDTYGQYSHVISGDAERTAADVTKAFNAVLGGEKS